MKQTFRNALGAAIVASLLSLAGCDSGDTGPPADQTPAVPLSTIKTDMKLPSQVAKEQQAAKAAEKSSGQPVDQPK
jgi:hypothetical protein